MCSHCSLQEWRCEPFHKHIHGQCVSRSLTFSLSLLSNGARRGALSFFDSVTHRKPINWEMEMAETFLRFSLMTKLTHSRQIVDHCRSPKKQILRINHSLYRTHQTARHFRLCASCEWSWWYYEVCFTALLNSSEKKKSSLTEFQEKKNNTI